MTRALWYAESLSVPSISAPGLGDNPTLSPELAQILAGLPNNEMLQLSSPTKPLPSTILDSKWEPTADLGSIAHFPAMLASSGFATFSLPDQLNPVLQIQEPPESWPEGQDLSPLQVQQHAQAAQQAATSAMATWGVRPSLRC